MGLAEENGRAKRLTIRAAAAVVVGSIFLAGASSMREDLVLAFRQRDLGIFPPDFAEQIQRVAEIAPPRAQLLLVAPADGAWRARLWQRALYPRNPVVVRYRPLASSELDPFRRSTTFVLALGGEPTDLRLSSPRRLDGATDRDGVWIGTLGH